MRNTLHMSVGRPLYTHVLQVGRVFEHAGFLVPVSLQQLRGDIFSVRFDDV